MKKFAVIMLVLLGCDDKIDFTIQEYIEESCVGNADVEISLDSHFVKSYLYQISEAIDYANDTLGVDMQICGLIGDTWDGEVPEGQLYILRDGTYWHYDSWYRTGHISGKKDKIVLYPYNISGLDHMYKVVLHEIGHFWGGHHSENPNDIMCQGWHGVKDYSTDDIRNILED